MKKGFTLLEINLAIMIMATGVLAILGLYGLGYRENRQSREDVGAAAYADAVLSPLVMALSSTNLTWETFNSIRSQPSETGWADYLSRSTGIVSQDPQGRAQSAYDAVMSKVGGPSGVSAGWPTAASAGLRAGLVVLHDEGSAIVRLGFRATRHPAELLAMPMFYTEVRFQGRTKLAQENAN